MNDVLNIDQSQCANLQRNTGGVVDDRFDLGRKEPDAGIDGELVA
jgi:hypothetical protein